MHLKFTLIYIIVLVALFANQALSKKLRKAKSGFCKGQVLNDGTQIENGSCSTLIQGEIPSKYRMPSTLIVSPKYDEEIEPNKKFTVKVAIKHLQTGKFSDPVNQYYIKPQELNNKGVIIGHSHITIQKLEDSNTPPAAEAFEFFKGLNEPAEDGILFVDVVKGLEAGDYRICTMTSSFTHQPVIMPIAQRGAQDDCIRVTVGKKKGH